MWKPVKQANLEQGLEYEIMDNKRFVYKAKFVMNDIFTTKHFRVKAYAVWI